MGSRYRRVLHPFDTGPPPFSEYAAEFLIVVRHGSSARASLLGNRRAVNHFHHLLRITPAGGIFFVLLQGISLAISRRR